jgi:hypothetical protein
MISNRSRASLGMLMGIATASACTSKPAASTDTAGRTAAAAPAADSAKAGGMAGMAGMQGMMSSAMMDSMHAQMQKLDGMTADQMAAMLPMHRQMAANMLSQMTADMRSMNMPADAAWTATTDSVRQDLIRLPTLSKAQLEQALPAHRARMMRLMQMHKDMMTRMGKS